MTPKNQLHKVVMVLIMCNLTGISYYSMNWLKIPKKCSLTLFIETFFEQIIVTILTINRSCKL